MELRKGDSVLVNTNPAYDAMFIQQGWVPVVDKPKVEQVKPEEKVEDVGDELKPVVDEVKPESKPAPQKKPAAKPAKTTSKTSTTKRK